MVKSHITHRKYLVNPYSNIGPLTNEFSSGLFPTRYYIFKQNSDKTGFFVVDMWFEKIIIKYTAFSSITIKLANTHQSVHLEKKTPAMLLRKVFFS